MKQDSYSADTANQECLTLWQAIKKWPRITWHSLALGLNLLLWGYDTGLVGNVSSMPEFQYVYRAFTDDIERQSANILTEKSSAYRTEPMNGSSVNHGTRSSALRCRLEA
jgi:hypothetical protein